MNKTLSSPAPETENKSLTANKGKQTDAGPSLTLRNSRSEVGGAVLGWGRLGGRGRMEIWVWLQSWEGFSEGAAYVLEKRFLSQVHSTYRRMEVWKT